MAHAALTYVYNEKYNLPTWIDYYGGLFGRENLFILDRMSNDGSTDDLGPVNVLRVPRTEFDDNDKSHAMSCLHSALLRSYDAVICSDCDEILVPEPDKYVGLNDYITRALNDYATGVGLNVCHIIDREPPLDERLPILNQRKHASFTSGMCKTLLSRVPLTWAPGLHGTKLPPKFDTDLFVFHLKLKDYAMAVARQKINQDTVWSETSVRSHHGVHHRTEMKKFVSETFLSALRQIEENRISEFEFDEIISRMMARMTINENGFYSVPFGLHYNVKVPERFQNLL